MGSGVGGVDTDCIIQSLSIGIWMELPCGELLVRIADAQDFACQSSALSLQ